MPVGFGNLDSYTRALIRGFYPDIGQTYYVVDSNFRTQAQGWTRPDRTGPLDLLEARRPGPGGVQYVFRTDDYASDSACIQAAHDATISFRGDALFFCPGAFAPATAINFTASGLRLLGRPVANPMSANVTITDGVGSVMALAATCDDYEMAFIRFVPITAAPIFAVTSGANGGTFHDYFYDTTGIAASTSTVFMNYAGVSSQWTHDSFAFVTDGAQGAMFVLAGAGLNHTYSNFRHFHVGGTLAISLLSVTSAGATGMLIGPGWGVIGGGGTVTNLLSSTDMTANGSNGSIFRFRGSAGYCAATGLFVTTGASAEWNLSDCLLGVAGAATFTAANGGTTYTH